MVLVLPKMDERNWAAWLRQERDSKHGQEEEGRVNQERREDPPQNLEERDITFSPIRRVGEALK